MADHVLKGKVLVVGAGAKNLGGLISYALEKPASCVRFGRIAVPLAIRHQIRLAALALN